MTTRGWPDRLLTTVYCFVALTFFLGFVTKFWPGPTFFGPAYSVKFVEWGYPAWFRFVVGGIEGLCAVLLVIPRKRTRFLGAVALMFLLTGATTTHIIAGSELHERVAAPTNLLIMTSFALLNWPSTWRDLLHPTAASRPTQYLETRERGLRGCSVRWGLGLAACRCDLFR